VGLAGDLVTALIVGAVALVALVLLTLQTSKAYASQAARIDAALAHFAEDRRREIDAREAAYVGRTELLCAELYEANASHRETLVQYRNQIFAESATHAATLERAQTQIQSILAAGNTDRTQLLNALMTLTGGAGQFGALKIADRRDPNLQAMADAARHGVDLSGRELSEDEELERELRLGGRYRASGRIGDASEEAGLTDSEGNVIIPVGAAGD
jgi:hypothetical protein